MIDLHIHTTYSDGTDTPLEVMQKAEALDLKQIAITDHNCIKGAVEAAAMVDDFKFEFLIGCELSCDINGKEVHLLGYFNNSQCDFSAIEKLIEDNLAQRINQHKSIISKFNELGFDVSYAELEEMFPNIIRNRVHIARLMISKGYAQTVDEVFCKYLKKGCPCSVKKHNLDLQSAIDAVHACNGKAVLAHFFEYNRTDITELLGESIVESIDGLEVYHSAHNPKQSEFLLKFARNHDKLITGGSDYHGFVKPDVPLGCANVPDAFMLYL